MYFSFFFTQFELRILLLPYKFVKIHHDLKKTNKKNNFKVLKHDHKDKIHLIGLLFL